MNNDMLPVGTTLHINPEDIKWEQQGGDLISREALIEFLNKNWYGDVMEVIKNAPTVADRYDEGFRDGYAQCINDKEERKENNRLFQKGDKEE